MPVDIKTISELRDRTGAGLADCKSALEEGGGDIEAAIEILRKKGGIKAAKKSDRTTTEGVIAMTRAQGKVAIVGLKCETDFVARNPDFIGAVQGLADKLSTMTEADFRPWAEQYIKDELALKIGENIQLGDSALLEGEIIGSYIHSNKKLAASVVLQGGDEALASDIAMHVSAMNPKYLTPDQVPTEEIEKEKEIYRALLTQEQKPEAIWDKIIEGKLAKYYEEVCLLNQMFIKDDGLSIAKLIESQGATIVSFARYQV